MNSTLYTQRRLALQQTLYVFTAHDAVQSRADASFPFVQDATFLYLTGIDEPRWQLIVDAKDNHSYLVAPTIDATHQLFDGGLPVEEARRISGVDTVLSLVEAETLLENLALEHDTVSTSFEHPDAAYYDFVSNPAQARLLGELEKTFKTVADCRKELAAARAIKSPEEIAAIKKAIEISIEGFKKVHDELKTTTYEYEIEATLSDVFRRSGSGGHAYTPIVAGGKNACTLHYDKNNDRLPENGFVLIDAGTQVDGYAADITRTYAVGTSSKRQQQVHEQVVKTHTAIIELIKPGLTFKDYHASVDVIMKQALENLKLLKKPEDYRTYFPHAISHGLGIDVHDSLGGFESFQPGMVLTVEPGIYIPEEGIGVRIEDDILVTKDGYENLSAALPIAL